MVRGTLSYNPMLYCQKISPVSYALRLPILTGMASLIFLYPAVLIHGIILNRFRALFYVMIVRKGTLNLLMYRQQLAKALKMLVWYVMPLLPILTMMAGPI
jgi:hypothetical protein